MAISTVALSLTGIGTVLTEAVTGVNITQAPLIFLITALVTGAACLTVYGVLLRLIGGCALGRQGAVRDMGLGAVFVSLPMLVLLAGGLVEGQRRPPSIRNDRWIAAGPLLCAAYQWNGRLWLPIGLHAGSNAMQSSF
ncbi:hypothetical protein [Trueperella pecoris]|uniref:Uncharacterized protein n=1 Tax=Trueperella pecoris TaxID=2733571 RepID=A0A7M1QSN0_9ACTO|nr:hypothetical protein [Trueperella pecoris]QOR44863.1 hypothetical protein INS88_06030 [Trueperella pecoris]